MRKKRLTTGDLHQEEVHILAFCLDRIFISAGYRTSMRDVFKAYQGWLKEHGHGVTGLSLDGFGRLFPKTYVRKPTTIDGLTRRALHDVGVKGV